MKRGLTCAVLAAVITIATPAMGQFVDEGSGPAENVRNRGARRPGLLVQRGIAQHTQGPEITASPAPDPEIRVLALTELIRNFFAQLAGIIPLLPDVVDGGGGTPGGGGGGGVNDIVMTEIAHNGNVVFVELLNDGPIETRLDGFRFHDGNMLSPALPVIELDRDRSIVVQLGGETQNAAADLLLGFRVQSVNAGELALYDFSEVDGDLLPVEDPQFMIDYVQWNDDDQDRDLPLESIASAANLWTTVDFLESPLANTSFRLMADAENRENSRSQDFIIGDFGANTLGVPESQVNFDDLFEEMDNIGASSR